MPSFNTIFNRLLIAITVPLVLAACSGGGPSMSAEQTTQSLMQASTQATETQQAYESTEAGAALGGAPDTATIFSSVLMSQSMGTLSHDGTNPQELDRHHYFWDENLQPAEWVDQGDPTTHDDLVYEWPYTLNTNKTALFTVNWNAGGDTITATNYEMGSTSEEVPVDLEATLKADGAEVGSAVATYGYYDCGGNPSTEVIDFASNGLFGTPDDQLKFTVSYKLDESGDPDVITSTGDVDLTSGGKHAGFDWDFTVRGDMQRDGCMPVEFVPSSGTVAFSAAAGSHSVAFVANFDKIVKTTGPNQAVIDPDVEAVDLNGSLKINSKTALTFDGTYDDADDDGMPGENLMLTFAGETKSFEAYMRESMASTALAALNFLR